MCVKAAKSVRSIRCVSQGAQSTSEKTQLFVFSGRFGFCHKQSPYAPQMIFITRCLLRVLCVSESICVCMCITQSIIFHKEDAFSIIIKLHGMISGVVSIGEILIIMPISCIILVLPIRLIEICIIVCVLVVEIVVVVHKSSRLCERCCLIITQVSTRLQGSARLVETL